MSTALVTDSTAYLPAALLEGLDVRVVPLHVVVGGRTHAEGVDIDPAAVAAALRAFTPVTPSRPTPAAFIDAKPGGLPAGVPGNRSPKYAPLIQPTLDTGTTALVTAALTWLTR